MPAPFGDGLFTNEPPSGNGLNITDLFHIIDPKPDDPGNDSRIDSKYPNVAIITPDNLNNRFGGMWAKEQLDLRMPFSTTIYLHLGHQFGKGDATVADGMTFTMHNDPDGIDAIGGADEGLGVYRGRKWKGTYWHGYPETETHGTYLKNSLVIEFDTYRNAESDGSFVDDPEDLLPAHCALLIPRLPTIVQGDHKNVYFFTPSQEWIEFKVNWVPDNNGGGILNYTFDKQQMLYEINSIESIFGGPKVYWGFTGATSYFTSVQAVAITKMPDQGIIVKKTVKNEAGADIDKGNALPGDTISYTIRVTARTVDDSIGPFIISDKISEYVTYSQDYVKVKTKSGDEFDAMSSYAGLTMSVNIDQLLTAEDDWIEITFYVRINDDSARSIVYNTALIEARGLADSQYSNTTEVTILEYGDPKKKVSDSSAAGRDDSAVKAGDEITYNISYTNFDAAVAAITITDTLPDGVNFVSAASGNYDGPTHTVTWTVPDVPAGGEGTVSLVVSVDETAVVKIENSATVKVGTHDPRFTNIVKNRITPEPPVKSVSDTSEAGKGGSAVKTGDKITYEITYLNYEETAATVVITDKLPDGVDFVSASNGGTHNDTTHTVTWTIPNAPSSEDNYVSLVVSVNESAVVKIGNSAAVTVGSNAALTTNIVENPVTPQNPTKKVSDSSAAGKGGSAIKVGDKITYEITYLNYAETATTVVITDKLPGSVDYISSSNGGKYNDALHTVIWTLENVPSGSSGIVSVVVSVNKRAVAKIENSATVKVGGNEPLPTNLAENPVTPEDPEKRISVRSAAGKGGSTVKMNDEITYDIAYRNYSEAAATIIITDRLPVGVDFVSASNGGTHNIATHTVTWAMPNVPSGDSGIVSVVVHVNEKAAVTVGNYATVQVAANSPRYTNYVENPVHGSHCLEIALTTKCRKIIKGKKTWADNNNASNTRPPAVDIILKRDGEIHKSISVSSTGNGSFAFGCLPIRKNSNKKYDYQVDEAAVPNGYRKTIEGYNIINAL